jgi:hypothetical protein
MMAILSSERNLSVGYMWWTELLLLLVMLVVVLLLEDDDILWALSQEDLVDPHLG